MPRYDFRSPGADFANAFEKELITRALMEQEALKQKYLVRQKEEENRRANDELELGRQREQRITDESRATREALEQQRRFQKANTIATHGLPGVIDEDTAGLLKGEGFGTLVNEIPGRPEEAFTEDESITLPGTPGVIQFAGGSQFQNQRAAEAARLAQAKEAQEARAAEGEANRAARAEQGEANRALREDLARMQAGNTSATTDLRNQLLQTQVDAAEQKKADKAAADKRAKDAARITSGATVDVLKELATFDEQGNATLNPGTANLYGSRVTPLKQHWPGSDTANAKAALDRLKGRVIVDLLNEMKNQSATGATGFGALSGPELKLLQDAAAELNNPLVSDERAAQELSRIYKLAKRLYGSDAQEQPAAGGAPSGGVVKWGRDAQGRPVRLQ